MSKRIVFNGETIGWGFIGCSTMGKEVMGPIVKKLPGCEVRGVYSSSLERGQKYAEENGFGKAYATLDEMLSDDDVQAVYISTKNNLHCEQMIAAAKAGKHVLCEKPIAINVEDCRKMVKAAEDAGIIFAVFHHQPALAQYKLMRKLVEEGKIGTPLAFRIYHTIHLPKEQLGTWRTVQANMGAGVVFDLATHDVDTSRFILQDEITEIYARGEARGVVPEDSDAVDNIMGVMYTKNRVMISFHDSYMINNENGCEALGTKGTLRAKEFGPYARIPAKSITYMSDRIKDDVTVIPVEEDGDPFELSVAAVNEAIRGNGEPIRSGLDGAISVATVLAAKESILSGKPEKVQPVK